MIGDLISECGFVVVTGKDEDQAFRRGRLGKGEVLWQCAPDTPLFNRLTLSSRVLADLGLPNTEDWKHAFFRLSRGWKPTDDVGIVLRYAHYLAKVQADFERKLDGMIASGARIPCLGCDLKSQEMTLAALTEPGEPLEENREFGPVGLGSDPEYAAICTRAVALAFMEELPQPGWLAVLRLPRKKAGNLRRYLFFGWRKRLFDLRGRNP